MAKPAVGVLGASSFVGESLLPLLANAGWYVEAYSRQALADGKPGKDTSITYRTLEQTGTHSASSSVGDKVITHWVCLAPIWVLPDYFPMLSARGVKRIVALGSTSIFTKQESSDLAEQETAKKLRSGEQCLIAWAEANRVEWIILRPTMIYGLGRDRNICEIARFILRFGFFPLLGAARGLRQPVHVEDVATACVAALQSVHAANNIYNLSGAEKLPYREMVERVFMTLGKPVRFVNIPLWAFRSAITCMRILPRFRNWSAAMAERMNADLVFDYADAAKDLHFSPRPFLLGKTDMPFSMKNNFR